MGGHIFSWGKIREEGRAILNSVGAGKETMSTKGKPHDAKGISWEGGGKQIHQTSAYIQLTYGKEGRQSWEKTGNRRRRERLYRKGGRKEKKNKGFHVTIDRGGGRGEKNFGDNTLRPRVKLRDGGQRLEHGNVRLGCWWTIVERGPRYDRKKQKF